MRAINSESLIIQFRCLFLALVLVAGIHQTNAQPVVPEFFNQSNLLPPTNTVYISTTQFASYANGIVLREVRLRGFTQGFVPPMLGNSQTNGFNSVVDLQLSTDAGATFQPATATAIVLVHLTHSSDAGGKSSFDTEMTQMTISGGSLPTGVMLRESPTLASTGKTTIRSVSGGYMISSFFDVFTEVSLDGGSSWTPSQQSVHLETRNDPATVTQVSEPTQLLPPPCGVYLSPQQWFALYAQGIVLRDVTLKLFTLSFAPPSAGTTNTNSFNLQVDLQVSSDGGNTFQPARVTAPMQAIVASTGSGSSGFYDAEMTFFNLNLPGGLLVRESPTEPSRGVIQIRPQADATSIISSFFDIFTELSLDGGASWSPATNGAARMQLTTLAPEVQESTNNLPPLPGVYLSPPQWDALYANGIIVTNASQSQFTQTYPLPSPPSPGTESYSSTFSGLISMNGGATFLPFSAPASVTVQINSRSDLDTAGTRFFDTEMLVRNISGGTLPGGVMIRESPSKASLGRTSVRTAGSGDYRIASFFDVYSEVSLDGGSTWSPSVTKPGEMFLATNLSIALGIAAAGGQAVVFWPASATNFVLQTTTNMSSTNWTTVTNGKPIIGVTLTNTSPAAFFRLLQQ